MGIQKKFFITALVVIFSMISGCASISSKSSVESAERFRPQVVSIASKRNGEQSNYGFGFVVGEIDNLLYVVTANHVLREPGSGFEADEISVSFFQREGSIKGQLIKEINDEGNDIGVIKVDKPDGFRWRRHVISPVSTELRAKVVSIGKGRKFGIDVIPGRVSSSDSSTLTIAGLDEVREGSSGAPVLTKDGLVGMISIDTPQYTTVVDINKIRNVLFDKTPWGLSNSQNTLNPIYVLAGVGGALVLANAFKPTPNEPTTTRAILNLTLPSE